MVGVMIGPPGPHQQGEPDMAGTAPPSLLLGVIAVVMLLRILD